MMRRILLALLLACAVPASFAATVVELVETADTGASPNSSGAFTPTASRTMGCWVQAGNSVDATPTLTNDSGLTYTLIRQETYTASAHSLYFWISNAQTTAVSQIVTADFPNDAALGTVINCFEVDITRTGTAAIRQEGGQTGMVSANTPNPTFDSPVAALTGNPTVGAVANNVNPATITEPTGWTEMADTGYASPTSGFESVFRNSGFTGTQITWGSTFGSGGADIIIELDTSAAASPPTFDSAPVVASQTTTAYTVNYDASADAVTLFGCARLETTSPRTGAQIEAGTGCVNTATEATTGSADSIVLTISDGDPLARYSLDWVLENAAGYSSVVSLEDEPLDAPSGRQYVTKSGAPGGGEVGILDGASPAAVDGDVMDASTLTDSFAQGAGAHALTVNANTTFSIASGGDTSRQKFTRRFYDVSLAAWSDASPVAYYVNNNPPVFVGLSFEPGEVEYLFEKDVNFSIGVGELFTDVEGDTLTLSFTNQPAGGATDGTNWTGPFTACGRFATVTPKATDIAGDFDSEVITVEVGERVPDVTDVAEATAITTIQAVCSFVASAGASLAHPTIAEGKVVSTSPVLDTLVIYDRNVSYSLSSGPAMTLRKLCMCHRIGF